MSKRSLTGFFPAYDGARRFLQILHGASASQYKVMWGEIQAHKGSPQETTNWKEPEKWIPERLTSESRALALRIWRESEGLVNPRYIDGCKGLCDNHDLLDTSDDVFQLTERGRRFVNNDKDTMREIDEYEGMFVILKAIAERHPAKVKDFWQEFRVFCLTYTRIQSDSIIKSTLRYRLANLRQREFILMQGHTYTVTDAGLSYLSTRQASQTALAPAYDNSLARTVKDSHDAARQQLARYLRKMNPYKFEHLIKLLLEEMGYDAVEVTKASNDKGVDVVAEMQVGISRVHEVIQVKRQQGNISRTVLDQLRGALYYFDAVRGTIITTGGFSKGAQDVAFLKNAPPITLIDGETLLNHLIEHNIGIRRKEIQILEFDEQSLDEFGTEDEVEF